MPDVILNQWLIHGFFCMGLDEQYVLGTGFPQASYRAFSLAPTSLIDLIFSKSSCCFQSRRSLLLSSASSK